MRTSGRADVRLADRKISTLRSFPHPYKVIFPGLFTFKVSGAADRRQRLNYNAPKLQCSSLNLSPFTDSACAHGVQAFCDPVLTVDNKLRAQLATTRLIRRCYVQHPTWMSPFALEPQPHYLHRKLMLLDRGSRSATEFLHISLSGCGHSGGLSADLKP